MGCTVKIARSIDGVVFETSVIPDDAEIADHFPASLGFRACGEAVVPGWIDDGATFSPPPPVVIEPAALKAHAAARRWLAQIAGTASGIPTDDGSRAAVAQAIQSIDLGIIVAPVAWKGQAGFVDLTRADLVAMAQAMASHVQACFDFERADVLVQIANGTITTTAQIDAAAWPA